MKPSGRRQSAPVPNARGGADARLPRPTSAGRGGIRPLWGRQPLDAERARRLAQAPPPALPVRIELPPQPVRQSQRPAAPARDPLEPAATRNCPHRQQPVTIVALLATPEAVRPTKPHHRTDIVPLWRTP